MSEAEHVEEEDQTKNTKLKIREGKRKHGLRKKKSEGEGE